MHIEPGLLAAPTLSLATAAAGGLLATLAPAVWRQPAMALRSVLAALCFTAFMQAFHLQVGPSELHFIGAMPILIAFGRVPTLFGFLGGLLLQGLLFEPQDLVHWAVNWLSLAVPLLAVAGRLEQRTRALRWADVLQLDARYYAGVTAMVGFWLLCSHDATPLADWLRFAASYLAVVALEPAVTLGTLALVTRLRAHRWAARCLAPALPGAAR